MRIITPLEGASRKNGLDFMKGHLRIAYCVLRIAYCVLRRAGPIGDGVLGMANIGQREKTPSGKTRTADLALTPQPPLPIIGRGELRLGSPFFHQCERGVGGGEGWFSGDVPSNVICTVTRKELTLTTSAARGDPLKAGH